MLLFIYKQEDAHEYFLENPNFIACGLAPCLWSGEMKSKEENEVEWRERAKEVKLSPL